MDSNGTLLWDKTIGGNLDESISDILQTPDNGYVLGISSNSDVSFDKTQNSKGGSDYWLVKLSADNLASQTFDSGQLSLYPNPSNDFFMIKNPNAIVINKVEIYATNGCLLKTIVKPTNDAFEIAALSTGIYLVKITSENAISNYKLVKK